MSASAERHQPSLSTAGYLDGLGRRTLRFDREVGGMLQALELRPEFSLYEPLLREAAGRLGSITDPRVASIASIERHGHGLVVCSPLVGGDRIEELLEARSTDEYAGPGVDAALGFLVRVLPAVSVLHRAGIVHGLLAPGRLALAPSGEVVLLDCIYAGAVERLRLSPDRLWTALGIAAPVTAGGARFDRGTDVRQVALTAVAIALGRPLQVHCTTQVIARLLQELSEVAQIRAGERFASEVRSLLEKAASMDASRVRSVDEIAAEAERLARTLGINACLGALAELSGTRAAQSELHLERRAVEAPPLTIRSGPPLPVQPAPLEEESTVPELSLDVKDTVEISLDEHAGLDFDGIDEPPVLVLDASAEESALFDWQPDAAGMSRRPSPPQQPALDAAVTRPPDDTVRLSDEALDWTPPTAADVISAETVAPVTDAEVVPWQLEVKPAPASEAAPVSVESPPVLADETPAAVAEVAAAPAPPPGIPLFRPASPPSPPPAPAAAAPPRPVPERSGGLKVYVPPPPRPVPPAPAVYTPPAPPVPAVPTVFVTPAPPPVVVIAPAPPAAVPLRLKENPAPPPRPRRMLDTYDDQMPGAGRPDDGSRGGRWKFVAAAAVVLAVGAFAGLPFLTSGPEPAAAEAAEAAAAPPASTAPAKAAKGGGLHIETQPSGAAVLLDGEDVGRTPLKLEDVKPGRHVITLSTDSTTVKRTVRIEAGNTVTLDVPVYSGWVAVYSPVPLHISEGSRMLGTTETTRVMLAPGRHELTLTNRELGYTTKQSVDIVAGEERVLNIEPRGSVSVNALPWAEVWVDGTRMGETPLANLDVPLGTREFVFKHPTYGERRVTTKITSKSPPLSVDFTRPGTRP